MVIAKLQESVIVISQRA